MPKKRRTPLERVAEARLQMIEGLIKGNAPADGADLVRAFRELCDAAEAEARRESDDAGIQALAERLSTLINAHNQLSDLVDDLRRPPRSGGGGTRRLG